MTEIGIEAIKTALADYEDILTFEEVGDIIKVKMQFQPGPSGKAKWEAINEQLKHFGGEWVSAGKMSHWKVKRETPQKPDEISCGLCGNPIAKEDQKLWAVGVADLNTLKMDFVWVCKNCGLKFKRS